MDFGQPENLKNREAYSENQVGGHSGIFIFEGNRLLKRAKPDEIKFYQWLWEQKSKHFAELRQFVPAFYGIECRGGNDYLVLENLLSDCVNPNLMDCKLGRITWTAKHSAETISRRKAKNQLTTTEKLGFKVSGLLVKNNQGEVIEHLIKKEAYLKINETNIQQYFRKIVTNENQLQVNVIEQFIRKIEKLNNWFERNRELSFKSSSILYVNGKNGKIRCKLIDFANTEDAIGLIDKNVIEGLQNNILIWQSLLK